MERYGEGKLEHPDKSVTFSTIHLTRIDLESNPGLCGDRPAINFLNHGTTQKHLPLKNKHNISFLTSQRTGLFSSRRSGPGPAHYRRFTITLRHTTLIRTTLDKSSARHRDLYLTIHNTHKRQAFMPPTGFEPTIPASVRPQNQTIDPGHIGIGEQVCCHYKFKTLLKLFTEMVGMYFETHFKHMTIYRCAVEFRVSKR